ncbi:integral peroxisomal membrane peroxin-domain-containing protein [Zychaea mexicana]|uniref:integral peroxisomal membrane peroxin-domain-containing protein n=1 Tax=Zychaea mexicana TaxID=64656 RepID=UPI0022FF00DE|nr:integral peroxisomal membrane peroxin-domain-containing protein [Zychaea mexicana]KAI9484582.1 integral peroxisomal membrane peroxin-domain-containing protein [Zychaea mexicana]
MPPQPESTTPPLQRSKANLSEILATLKPYIHALVVFARLLQWKPLDNNQTNPMVLVVLLWTALCFHHKLLLGIVAPVLIVSVLLTSSTMATPDTSKTRPHGRRRSTASNSSDKEQTLENDDPILSEITHDLAELAKLLSFAFVIDHNNKNDGYSENNNKKGKSDADHQRTRQLAVGVCLMLFWQWILHTSRLYHLVWLTGCMFLTWWSPWVHALRHMICHIRKAMTTMTTTTPSSLTTCSDAASTTAVKQELDRLYCFSIYEHQRWWLHRGWSNFLLPHDRPEWSDEYLEPTPSIHAFNLPPSSTSSHWVWVDPSWNTDKSGVVTKDDGGWEYGNWDWKAWSNKATGLSVLTRRRRWIRCARRVECTSDADVESIAAGASAASTQKAESVASSPLSSGCSSPSLLFSPKPRPTSLLTHRTLSSITTISSSTSSSLSTSCDSPLSSPFPLTTTTTTATGKDCGTHFWLHR